LGERSRGCKPRQACNITLKGSAQVAEVGHWKKSKVCIWSAPPRSSVLCSGLGAALPFAVGGCCRFDLELSS
jgi:hypothetical protein